MSLTQAEADTAVTEASRKPPRLARRGQQGRRLALVTVAPGPGPAAVSVMLMPPSCARTTGRRRR